MVTKDDFIAKADQALVEPDPDAAEKLYEELVALVSKAYGDNQKEVAAELARLAKKIEEEGRLEEAIRLKQRTCSVLLKMSMAARHGRIPQDYLNQPPPSRDELAFLLFVTDSSGESMTNLANLVSPSARGELWFRTTDGTTIVIHPGSGRHRGFVPIFTSSRQAGAGADRIVVQGAEVFIQTLGDGARVGLISREAHARLKQALR